MKDTLYNNYIGIKYISSVNIDRLKKNGHIVNLFLEDICSFACFYATCTKSQLHSKYVFQFWVNRNANKSHFYFTKSNISLQYFVSQFPPPKGVALRMLDSYIMNIHLCRGAK